MKKNNPFLSTALMSGVLSLFVGGQAMAQPAPVAELRPGMLVGYLTPEELPHALSIIPPAPEPDSAAFAWEQAINQNMLALRGTPRWDLATYSAKDHYQRLRPFVTNGEPICAEGAEERLASDGSYPSGHTAIGWAWALILGELAPERADAIAQRGLAFGDSRMVCNVHWPMDVIQGQIVAAATVAKLHSNAGFREDMAGAAREIEQFSGKGLGTNRDCEAEAVALQIPVER